jgi:hypothetical protein
MKASDTKRAEPGAAPDAARVARAPQPVRVSAERYRATKAWQGRIVMST